MYDHNSETIRHARTIAQVPAPMKWSIERVKEMLATPWKSREPTEPGVISHQPADQAETKLKMPTIRRFYIRQDDIDARYTPNCPKRKRIMAHEEVLLLS